MEDYTLVCSISFLQLFFVQSISSMPFDAGLGVVVYHGIAQCRTL